ncbi:MAG: radical SAM protein [Candidatus Hinthialibacter antarcticus]|nr:radical SAM protein [Candidatus Hinthialibacter antarcticus]
MKILLLNPPADKPYLRDYYCSHTAKGYYYWHPYDLVVQSGVLARHFEVEYLDANVLKLSNEAAAERIWRIKPDGIVFLTGGVCYKEDLAFLESLRIPKSVAVVGTGDVMVSKGRELMTRHRWLAGVLLNFTSHSLDPFFKAWNADKGEIETSDPIPNILFRKGDEFIRGVDPGNRYYTFPLPRYDLIPNSKYRIPHGRRRVFASFLTDFGCPYRCNFCFNGKWTHKLRDIDNAIQELHYLKTLGIHELWIKDLTFGVTRTHTVEFLERMLAENLKFDWVTLSRVDVMDEELLTLMARAGCHTIQFGVESADQGILNSIEKDIEPERVRQTFALCRKLGIRTLAHFILGLPGETEDTAKGTIEFTQQLDPDFLSINVAAPRMGTDLRAEAIKKGWVDKNVDSVDNSSASAFPQMQIGSIAGERVIELRNQAIRDFHLRPSYLWRKAADVRTPREAWRAMQNGYTLLKSTLHKPTLQEIMDGEG